MEFTDKDLLVLLNGSKYFEGGEDNGYRKMIVALVKRLKCAEKALFSERCPNCPDQGFWVQKSQGVAEQFQCEWCETTPNSRFLAEIAWRKSKGE